MKGKSLKNRDISQLKNSFNRLDQRVNAEINLRKIEKIAIIKRKNVSIVK